MIRLFLSYVDYTSEGWLDYGAHCPVASISCEDLAEGLEILHRGLNRSEIFRSTAGAARADLVVSLRDSLYNEDEVVAVTITG